MLYFCRFWFNVILFGIRLVQRRSLGKKHSIDVLTQMEQSLNGKFDAATHKKVVKSHSVYLPIVNDAFTLLHGRLANQNEQLRSINYFICSSLFDNFWDDKSHTPEHIEKITFNPDEYAASSFDEKAFLQSHTFLLAQMPDTEEYLQVLRNEFNAQQASMQQFDANITNEAIQHITFEKGGNAVLMCRYYLDVQPTKPEEECWYLLGTMIQLSNDLFDIYKDLQHNIQTLPVRITNAYEMETFFLKQVNKMKQNIKELPYNQQQKFAFSLSMAATYCLGLTAIEQLKKLQAHQPNLPNFTTLPRKALIVDMEKPATIWQWIKLVYKHSKI
jgi:hypothetical protein